jgi:alpha-mannosidase
VWVGELYLELHRATLTSQHQTKQGNRRTEHLLVEAELWSATAAVRGLLDYPYDELDALWKQVLLQQFHDILPGTSIAWVHREAVDEYERVTAGAEALVERALRALVGEGEQPITVNGAPFTRHGIPAYAARPVGSSTLGAEPGGVEVVGAEVLERDGGHVLRNALVSVTFDADGLITSAVDRATGRDAIAPGAVGNLLQLHQDFPNMWDAWDVDRFYRNRVTDLRSATSVSAALVDGVAQLVVERSISADSTVRQVISLEPGSRVLEFAQTTDWHETEKFLKVAFPLDVRAEHSVAETQFGHHKRPTHTNTSWEAAKFETSMHRYLLVEEPGFGVALVNDSSYGFDLSRDAVDGDVTTTVRLSLLRAPRFPDPETDQGEQTHRYGLVVGADIAAATEAGALLNTDERAVAGGQGFDPLVVVTGTGVVLSSVKLAADRSGDLVVRLYESQGARTQGELAFGIPVTEAVEVVEVNLLEEELDGVPVRDLSDTGSIPLSLKAFDVRTFRLRRSGSRQPAPTA